MSRLVAPLVVACALSAATEARAAAPDWLERARQFAADKLAQAIDAREPPLQPPQPIEVTYRARRIGSVDLGAPLLELAAFDLDGDDRDELVALTTRELLVFERTSRNQLTVRSRTALPEAPAPIQPRDPVGALSAGPAGAVRARSSTRAAGAVYEWDGERLVAAGEVADFPLCPQLGASLEPGRNYFAGADGAAFYAVRCFTGMVDPEGRRLAASAVLPLAGPLSIRLRIRCPRKDEACREREPRVAQVEGAGVAFAVADIDNDGTPELITSSDAPPGSPDAVRVLTLAGDAPIERYRKELGGGVVGIAGGDLDGDGNADVVVAARAAGSTRIEWWTLN